METKSTDNVWKGVAIAEGFEDSSVMDLVTVVGTKAERLEAEEGLGEFHFHNVEVPESVLPRLSEAACRTLRPSWYFHLVQGKYMKVFFRDKMFDLEKGNQAQLQAVTKYGLEHGVHEEQIQLARLFDNPYDD